MSVHQIRPGMDDHRPVAMRLKAKIKHAEKWRDLIASESHDFELILALDKVVKDRCAELTKCKEGGMI